MNDFTKFNQNKALNLENDNGPPLQLNQFLAQKLDNPIIKTQFIPSEKEAIIKSYELSDPINDDGFSPLKGLIHRYYNRVLIKLTNQCEAYCRFCFRRDFVGTKAVPFLSESEITQICDYIKDNPQINEVIFSGGDPLVLSPRRIGEILRQFQEIAQLRSIRIHTRLPIHAPYKINDDLIDALKKAQKPINIIIHCNHFSEIDEQVESAISKLKNAGFNLFSQSVLLAQINDNIDDLCETFNRLSELSIKPYYLHHLDFARGTSHFAVSLKSGLSLYKMLRQRLSGIALPKYMLDLPNGSGKVQLSENNIRTRNDGHFEICDNQGNWQFYTNIELQ